MLWHTGEGTLSLRPVVLFTGLVKQITPKKVLILVLIVTQCSNFTNFQFLRAMRCYAMLHVPGGGGYSFGRFGAVIFSGHFMQESLSFGKSTSANLPQATYTQKPQKYGFQYTLHTLNGHFT